MASEEQLQAAYDQGFQAARIANEEYENKVMINEFRNMRMELRANGIANLITTYNGDGPEKYQKWVKEIERMRAAVSADDDRSRALALQTLSGSAADYATRLIQENDDITWEELKKKLGEHYNDLADVQYARQQLRRLTQRPGESIQNYYERIMQIASNAFGSTEITDKHVEPQLIDFFIDGLRDDGLVKRLLRKSPKTLADAFKFATNEQQAQRSYDLRRGRTEPEPMEVDVLTSNRNFMSDHRNEQVSAQIQVLDSDLQQLRDDVTRGMEQLQQILLAGQRPRQEVPQNQFNQPPVRSQQDYIPRSRQNLQCWRCGIFGHYKSECRTRSTQFSKNE